MIDSDDVKCLIWCNLQTWCAKLRNNQVLPYFFRDSVVLHDTGGATQQNTNIIYLIAKYIKC